MDACTHGILGEPQSIMKAMSPSASEELDSRDPQKILCKFFAMFGGCAQACMFGGPDLRIAQVSRALATTCMTDSVTGEVKVCCEGL